MKRAITTTRILKTRARFRPLIEYLDDQFAAFVNDNSAAEMAEWVLVVAFVLASTFVIYDHILTAQLNDAVDQIGSRILDAASGNLGGTWLDEFAHMSPALIFVLALFVTIAADFDLQTRRIPNELLIIGLAVALYPL
jgi:Flp pilus assembly pilin Flp